MDEKAQEAHFRDQEELNTANRARLLGLQYLDTRGDVVPQQVLVHDVLQIPEMYQGHIVPLTPSNEDAPLVFGITITTSQQLLRQLRDRFNDRSVQFVMMSNSGFKDFMLRYDPPKKVVYDDVKIASEGASDTIDQVSKTLAGVRTDDILSYLVTQADKLYASDIHFETQREVVRIRFRIDGTLHPVAFLDREKYRIMFASLASRANISTAAKDAQTGHMIQDVQDGASSRSLNMRVETVPTIYGQDVVIRLFNFDVELLQIKNLGLTEGQRKNLEEVIEHPHGMVLIVGPTGSGKSTTLYSIINALNSSERKILTLEDPVEYAIAGISQIPVNTDEGDSFGEKLRAVLRLDPDVVMVGEIRDADTAKTAIQAAITGHLVLSTFHANSAATAFSRMIDMVGQNPIFSTAIRLVVGQRLVRRLDDDTKEAYTPDDSTRAYIERVIDSYPEGAEKPDLSNLTLYRPGKSPESPFGFKGRIVIAEQMLVTPAIQGFLRDETIHTNAEQIEKTAQEEGMLTMLQEGMRRVVMGETTLEEIMRAI